MKNFKRTVIILLSMVVSPIINGYVLMKLWMWFIVPTFETQPLRMVEAVGLMILTNYLKSTYTKNEVKDNESWETFNHILIFTIVYSILVLFSGWVVSCFI